MSGPLPALTLFRVFWRSLFLQAAWNPKGMQNLGFAYALYPALKRLYPEHDALEAAVDRHLRFFNTHPYAAAAILGGAIHHEVRIARGEERPEKVEAYKQALMGPLAALGDGFFWLSLRPACGALAAASSVFLDLWGILVYLVSYNVIHLLLRARLFVAGYRLGDAVLTEVARARLPQRGEKLKQLAALAAGAAAGLVAGGQAHAGASWAASPLVGAGVFAGALALLGRGASPYAVVYGAAAVTLFLGMVF